MEFRLLYDGRLPSQGRTKGKNRGTEKHQIRKVFHEQLKALWEEHPALQRLSGFGMKEQIASEFNRSGFNFCPLIGDISGGSFASLDILFLRRDHPGNLIKASDIDNRVKVLFDALKVPERNSEIGATPDDGEDPFYTLLQDDKLITSVNITTDRLLSPFTGDHSHPENDVVLVIHVKTGVFSSARNYAEAFW
jgi:hypothetical protein